VKRLLACILTVSCLISAEAAPYESRVRAIDQEVRAIDQAAPGWNTTSAQACNEEHTCTTTLSYWDTQGRLRKTVDKAVSDINPSLYTGRYYSDCRLIFARTAPAGREAVKHLNTLSKYYFHNGKLIRVTKGDEIEHYSDEQMKDTQHLMDFKPAACTPK
jgi:hypothetical protein